MAKFYALGNYTAQGFQGFIKDPKTDRAKAAQVAAEAVGAKVVSYTGLRGAYDFWQYLKELLNKVLELKWQLKQAELFVISQSVKQCNINEIAENAAKIAKAYKGPGQ